MPERANFDDGSYTPIIQLLLIGLTQIYVSTYRLVHTDAFYAYKIPITDRLNLYYDLTSADYLELREVVRPLSSELLYSSIDRYLPVKEELNDLTTTTLYSSFPCQSHCF